MAIFMFIFSAMVCISVSLLTNPPNYASISGLSMGTLTAEDRKINRESISVIDIVLSVLLLLVVISVLTYFVG